MNVALLDMENTTTTKYLYTSVSENKIQFKSWIVLLNKELYEKSISKIHTKELYYNVNKLFIL